MNETIEWNNINNCSKTHDIRYLIFLTIVKQYIVLLEVRRGLQKHRGQSNATQTEYGTIEQLASSEFVNYALPPWVYLF